MLETLSQIQQNGYKSKSKPIFFGLPAGYSGCAWWRYRLPFAKLDKLGSRFDIHIADNPDKQARMSDLKDFIDKSDVISMQAPGFVDGHFLIQLYKSQKKKAVVDYDDFSFDLDPGNPKYRELGIRETDKWKDGQDGFDLKFNLQKYEAFKACVLDADLVTTTTEHLADKFREWNKNVIVCPNSIDFDRWKPIKRPTSYDGQIRIGWFGGDSHAIDLDIFKTVLPNICKRYPQVKIVLQCPPMEEWQEFFKDIPPSQMDWHNWVDLRHYTLFLAARHIDIGLCPLGNIPFNEYKSSIKYFEFSALEAATVAQDMKPYKVDIDGENGLLASTEEEWEAQISKLVEDEKYRRDMARNAYDYVYEKYNLDRNCFIWEQAFLNCLEGS